MPDTQIAELRSRIRGPVNSIPTPFTRDGEVDWDGVRSIIDVGIEGGSQISLLTYGDSQFDFLTDAEVAELTRVLAERARGRAVTVAATKRWWTRQAVEFADYCRGLGIDMLMMLPSDHAVSATGKIAWYKAAARVIPVMLVGYPTHEILDGLLDEPGICSFKEDGTLDYAIDVLIKYAGAWEILTGGSYRRHLTQHPYGCRAFFSWTSCFAPHVARRYWDAIQRDDLEEARRVVAEVEVPFTRLAATAPEGWQDLWRAAMELNGVAQRYLRPPRLSFTDEQMEKARAALTPLGLVR